MRTILETLTIAAEHLERAGVDSPRLTAELMLAHVLECQRLDLYLKFDQPLKPEERESFGALYKRRLEREPLQYVLGTTNFCGLEIDVNKDVLIPRPETEELVELVKTCVTSSRISQPSRILDIGTGSGCIALALAAGLPESRVEGIDVSEAAIAVARRNAERLGIANATFRVADVFDDDALDREYDVIVSNPPYVSAEEIEHAQLEVREFEPRIATTDNADGLTFYRRIAAIGPQHVRPGGVIVMEVGMHQAAEVQRLFDRGGTRMDITRDSAGIERIVTVWDD